jgi:hypothetical protein
VLRVNITGRTIRLEELLAIVDDLAGLAKEAGSNFDYLRFESEELPPNDFSDVLDVCLTGLEEDLAQLALDLRTIPWEAAA